MFFKKLFASAVALFAIVATSNGMAQQINPPDGLDPMKWNDTYLGYRYGEKFHYPGSRDDIAQNIGYVTSVGGFRFGSYAFTADYIVADSSYPASGGRNAGGAQGVFAIGRIDFSAGKVLGTTVSNSVVRDLGLTVGFDFGSKNDTFGQGARVLKIGPSISFQVPHGFWIVSAGFRKEKNHNGFTGKAVDFDPTWYVESSWQYPFRLGPAPLLFRGLFSVAGPKGKDGFGVESKTEFLTRVALLADLGTYIGYPRSVYAGVGYMYWYQAYGVPVGSKPGTITSVPMLQVEVHF